MPMKSSGSIRSSTQTFSKLHPGRIGHRSFRDPLSVCKQLGNKAGSSLRIVPSKDSRRV